MDHFVIFFSSNLAISVRKNPSSTTSHASWASFEAHPVLINHVKVNTQEIIKNTIIQ